MLSKFLASLALCVAAAANPVVHDASFTPDIVLRGTAQNITIACQSRYSTVINGTMPAPTIHLKEGHVTWIRVYNDQPHDNLTMHWHGLSQRAAPFSDGSPQASQWPIPPGHFFDYEIRPEVGEAGTYFYHSHVDFQAITAVGVLIVDEVRKPPYAYSDERTFLFQDYYNKTDATITKGLLSNPFVWSGEANALLLNGQSGTAAGNATKLGSTCAPAIIKVRPGKTYRFRWIGGTAISLVTVGIEGHSDVNIIEADGAYTQSYKTDHLQVSSGQRFSTLFKAKSLEEIARSKKTQYWIQFENRERPANTTGYAILQYDLGLPFTLPKQLPAPKPVTLPTKVYDWLEYALQPLNPRADPFPTRAEVTRTIYITVEQLRAGYFNWAQNGAVWQESRIPEPYLVKVYKDGEVAIPDYNAAIANNGWDPDNLAFPAKIGEVLDIVWVNNGGVGKGFDFHPFHAHGGHYWDLGSGNGTYNAAENDKKFAKYTPAFRDTTVLYRYSNTAVQDRQSLGWRAWRLKVRYPGAWMIHCHILQHMIMGMQTAWVFGNAQQIAAIPQPYVSGYLDYGGSAYGNETHDPVVNHYYST